MYDHKKMATGMEFDGYDLRTRMDMMATGMPILSMSAWPYSLQDMEQATHIDDLPTGDYFTVNLDGKQMGVGGNTWNRDAEALTQYRLMPNHPYHYAFFMSYYNEK